MIKTCKDCKYHSPDNSNFTKEPCTDCYNFNKLEPVDIIRCCFCKYHELDNIEDLDEQIERCMHPINCKNFVSKAVTANKQNVSNTLPNSNIPNDDELKYYEALERKLDSCFTDILSKLEELKQRVDKIDSHNDNDMQNTESTNIEDVADDVLKRYKEDTNNCYVYFLDSDSEVDSSHNYNEYENASNPYCNYPTIKLAQQSAKIKMFNDILLAFKYCYEEEYKPNWTVNNNKYFIHYDSYTHEYEVDVWSHSIYNVVVFGDGRIAQMCVEYLNEIDPTGSLIGY